MEKVSHSFEVRFSNSYDLGLWNKWVAVSESGTLFQTTLWADRICELWDCDPFFFEVHERGIDEPSVILLGFEVNSDAVPEVESFRRWLRRSIRGILQHNSSFRWFGRPVIIGQPDEGEALKRLLKGVEDLCRIRGIHSVVSSEVPLPARHCLPNSWQSREWATLLVNLRLPEDALWANLKKTARKAIRSAVRNSVSVRRVRSLDELRTYYDFACECAARSNKQMQGFADFETMWRYFHENAVFETFVAEKDGHPIAGLSVWGFNKIIQELGSFQSERSFKEKLYGPDLVKWEVIRWGAMQGLHTFDLAGISPQPTTEKERGIRQFKEKWGGRYEPQLFVNWSGRDSS